VVSVDWVSVVLARLGHRASAVVRGG
jgi:hypothetical protein